MSHVFLSHNHADKPFVRMVSADIRASGLMVWLDELELAPGDSIIARVAEAVGDAEYVVAFLSPNSIGSHWVQKELSIGLTLGLQRRRVVVVPVLIGDLRTDQIPYTVIDLLYVDFSQPAHYDAAFSQLLRRLKPEFAPERVLSIDDARRQHLLATAREPAMAAWVTRYLIETLPDRRDATERYWSYVTLGDIGGPDAAKAIAGGLTDATAMGQQGARDASEQLQERHTEGRDARGILCVP
ncbi:MAG: toll/interleukin-1 receptor domain-containing protein [Armatimonadetes bacterium]|nr:toll/interleukin-1 receptor domain-containing protein [Armatimonadota bacterium]